MIVRGAVVALLVALPALAWAHGEHDDATHATGAPTLTTDGYQIDLVSQPTSPALGERSQIAARIMKDGVAVSGAEVLIGVARGADADVAGPASEVTWAGHYAVPFTPTRPGAYHVRVVLAELDGQRFEPPLAVVFPLVVARRAGIGAATWVLLALVTGVAFVGISVARLRARAATRGETSLDLLRIGWLRRLLISGSLQRSLQIPLLVLTAIVVLLGLHDVQSPGLNVATRLTWTVWWAGVIFTFVLAGRAWCLACPFGAVNEWTSRVAAPRRRLPRAFRNLWWATAAFVLLTWADEQLGVVRSPRVTAWLILVLFALAVAVGVLYERRSFCRYLCPIGGLIGLYAMAAPLELRTRNGATCREHDEKECYRGGGHSRGCPMFEFPQAMDRNNYCNLCGECAGSCSRDNLALRFRAPGKDLWATRRRFLDESYLAVVLVGLTLIVTAEMLTAWPGWVSALARWLPSAIRTGLKPVTYLGIVESTLLLGAGLAAAPLLLLAAAGLSNRLAGGEALGLRRTFVVFGYMFIPIGLGMHLAHNLAHLLLEGGAIVPAVQRAIALYTPLSLGTPDWQVTALAPAPVVAFLQPAVLVGFFILSLVAGHRMSLRTFASPRSASRALVPMATLALLFTVAGIVLLSLPMAMRHGT